MSVRISRVGKYFALLLVVLLGLFVVLPYYRFPGEGHYRRLIGSAKSIELQYLPAPNYTKYFTMAEVPASDKTSIDKLARSIDFRGVWLPFTDVSGNVYRLRVTEDDGSWEDIVVLGADKIRYGNWAMPVSPKAVTTVKEVVVARGGRFPDNQVLFELLGGEQGSGSRAKLNSPTTRSREGPKTGRPMEEGEGSRTAD